MKSPWLFGVIAACCVGLAVGVGSVQGADLAHFQAIGFVRFGMDIHLPDVRLPDVQGKAVALRSFQGKVVLLNFWTTW